MPYKKKTTAKKKTYTRRRRFVPRGLAVKRSQQISTKTFYFKEAGRLAGTPAGTLSSAWTTLLLTTTPFTPNIPGDFDKISIGYQEYKCLAIKLTLFAANIGTGSAIPQATPNQVMSRGMTCIYKDQDYRQGQPIPTQITDVINLGSAKVIPSRCEKWTTILYRPKGHPEWGNCDQNTPAASKQPDSWSGAIQMLSNGVSNELLWYYTATYKVVFRGRAYAT